MEKIPLTRAGHTALNDELKKLKSEERPAVIRAIAEAREHGDLSENAEYHAAREKQSFIEGRVKELEAILSLLVSHGGVEAADRITAYEQARIKQNAYVTIAKKP